MRSRRGRKVAVSMRESHKNVSFSTCQKMCSCRFARQAWHFVSFDVCEEESVCAAVVGEKLPCLWEKSFSTCQKMCSCRFCAAGVALCDM